MSNETLSTQTIGTPAVKLGETNGWYARFGHTSYDERKFKVCPKSIKLLKEDGKYAMWKPSAKNPMVGAVVEFHGGQAVWTGEGDTYVLGFYNRTPKTHADLMERFNYKNPLTKQRTLLHEFFLLSTPNDRVEYRVVPAVFYYVGPTPQHPEGGRTGPYTMSLENLRTQEAEKEKQIAKNPNAHFYRNEYVEFGVLIETWVWWAGRIPIRTHNGYTKVKLPYHDDYTYSHQPQYWIGLREFRNASLNTPPRAFNDVETAVRNKHNDLKEELAAAVFHPTRMVRMMATYGADWDERI